MSFVKVMNKKICLLACLLAFSCFAGYAQADASGARLYELYPTQNIYTFLKLNTKTGQITQLQYSISANDDRMELNVNTQPLLTNHCPRKAALNSTLPRIFTTFCFSIL